MGLAICVYCSSSDAVGERYFDAARELGRLVAAGGHSLVYGGGGVGLMGAVAAAAKAGGAMVTGVIPEALVAEGVAGRDVDRLVITRDLRERKAAMQERSEAFVALPGGFGTLEELMEIATLAQLGCHRKPVAVVSTDGFYDALFAQLARMEELGFVKEEFRPLLQRCAAPAEAIAYIEAYTPVALPRKWTRA